ncbi:MAG TPA: protein kinase [Gemmatimonadales bacterium]|jgi:serine/threonine-protein kinase
MRANQAADAAIDRGLVATQSAIEDALASRSQAVQQVARVLAQVPSYIVRIDEALRTGARDDIFDQAEEFRDQAGATWAIITDRSGVVQASSRSPAIHGEPLGGPLVESALAGGTAEGVWIETQDGIDSLFQAVSVPLAARGAAVSGALILAVPVDGALAERLKRQTASEVVFTIFDTLGKPQSVVASTLPTATIDSALRARYVDLPGVTDSVQSRLRIQAAGRTWIAAAGPLRTASGLLVGEYAGLRARQAELAPFTALQRSVLYAFLGALAVALVISLFLARQITDPVRRLVAITRNVAEGRYTGEVEITSRDEIGELAEAFQGMLSELREKQRLVEFLGSSPTNVRTQVIPPQTRVTGSGGEFGVGGVLAGRYEIREKLGAGGMGVVYRAFDRELKESVAIKTLRPELVGDPTLLERFKQEIRLARRISHPNVVRTHDLGEAGGLYFITMEFVEGTGLDEVIRRRGALPLAVTLTIGRQLCRALEVAHAQGIVHRDIKPPNLVVDAQGFLKVMDFGIARLVEGRQVAGAPGLTAAGSVIGTPEYMAPEQLLGHAVDGRADLYATGVVLFECATGKRLFTGDSFATVLMKQVQEPPPDPRTVVPALPEGFSAVVLRALAKEPEQRWQTATDLLHALEAIRT